MSDRHDLRRQTREIHEALSRFEREQLVDILTHIFRTYVMEGAALAPPPPSALSDELAGMGFAQIIERLQLRSDLPELQLFEVQGNRVSVRVDGRLVPLDGAAGRSDAPPRPAPVIVANLVQTAPTPPAASAAAGEPRPSAAPAAPGVTPAGHAGSSRPEAAPRRPEAARAASTAAAPAGGPAGHAASRPAAASSGPAAAQSPAAAPPAPAKPEPRPAEDSSAGGRFGLLEID
jgi:hypothetical protein